MPVGGGISRESNLRNAPILLDDMTRAAMTMYVDSEDRKNDNPAVRIHSPFTRSRPLLLLFTSSCRMRPRRAKSQSAHVIGR